MAAAPLMSSAQDAVPSPWTAQDIGRPAAAGTTSFNQGTFSIAGSGEDIWDSSDQFRFVYQQIIGDVEIIARVNALALTDVWSKSGVMIRSSLDATAANAFALVSGQNGTNFQRRTTAGQSSAYTAGPPGAAPYWVRLVRAGNRVTGYASSDGRSWTTIASDTIDLGTTAYVGLAVTSHSDGVLAASDVSQVSISSQSLPTSQQTEDIGSPAIPGTTSFSAGTYTITAAGTDIWDTSDQFRYVYQPITGDVDVVARVASLSAADPWSKAGVMIRESLSPDARHAMSLVSAQNGMSFQRRIDASGFCTYDISGSGGAPQWVRLVRTGSQFQAFRSTDGLAWTLIGTDTVPMDSDAYVGIAVTSHNPAATTTAIFDNFAIAAVDYRANRPPVVTLTQPANGASYAPGSVLTIAATASDPENRLSRVEFYSGTTRVGSYPSPPFSMKVTLTGVSAGAYSLFAVAVDADGGSATSNVSTINVTSGSAPPPTPPPPTPPPSAPPRYVGFGASADHNTLVSSYRLDVFAAGANPNSATRLTYSDLGKPTPNAAGDITVDRLSFFSALAPGTYVATVSAVGSGGEGRGGAVTFSR